MMHKNEVKILTESVMMGDQATMGAQDAAKGTLYQLSGLKDMSGAGYRAAVINLRNSAELRRIAVNPAGFKSAVMSRISSGALSHTIRMHDAALVTAMINAIRGATTTSEPITVFEVYVGADLDDAPVQPSGLSNYENETILKYDHFNLDLGKSVSDSLDRMIDAINSALKNPNEHDAKVLVGYGQALTLVSILC